MCIDAYVDSTIEMIQVSIRDMGDLIVIGGGVAGHRAACELSRLGGEAIRLVGAEVGRPYDRPPLSKDYLMADEAIRPGLSQSDIYDGGAMLHDGLTVTRVDRDKREIHVSDGARLRYDKLLIATGSRLRQLILPDIDPARIFYLRTIDDAARLRAALIASSRVTIIGGGFIGLEVAAAARQLGCQVTLLERAATLLPRGATPFLADYVHALHARRGVDVFLNVEITGAFEDAGGVTIDWPGGQVHSDIVVVGVGVMPNVDLAVECGLVTDDGIHVDRHCRTSDDAIFAAGEVTRYPVGRLGLSARTESWSAASAQAIVAAQTMLGHDASFDELPWFWSDQYDVNVQCLGLPNRASRFLQIGEAGSDSWLRIGFDGAGNLVGAEAVNRGRDVSALRRTDRKGQAVPQSLIDQAIKTETSVLAGAAVGGPSLESVLP